MSKIFEQKRIQVIDYAPGKRVTVPINRSRGILHSLYIFIQGKITLTAGVVSAPGGIARLAKNIKFSVSGYDPATGKRYNDDNRINTPGWAFAYNASTGGDLNGKHRINLFEPGVPILSNGEQIQDINLSLRTEQSFQMVLKLPFNFSDNIFSDRDSHLDMANLYLAELEIDMGDVADLGREGGTAVMGAIKECTFEVVTKEMRLPDPLTYNGSPEFPQMYLKANTTSVNISADNTAYRHDILLGGNYFRQFLIGYNASGTPVDTVVEEVSIQRNTDSFYDLTAKQIRYQNNENHPRLQELALLKDSGLLIIEPAQEVKGWQASQTRYLGASAGASQLFMKTKTGKLDIITMELITSEGVAAATRDMADMTPGMRAINKPSRDAMNQRAQQIESAAQATGVRVSG